MCFCQGLTADMGESLTAIVQQQGQQLLDGASPINMVDIANSFESQLPTLRTQLSLELQQASNSLLMLTLFQGLQDWLSSQLEVAQPSEVSCRLAR